MRELFRRLNHIFDRRTKIKLLFATVATVFIALLDTAAIALVLPLVNLASGQGDDSGVVDMARTVLDNPDPRTLTLVLTAMVVGLFVLKDVGAVWYSWWLSGFKVFNRVNLSSRLLSHFLTAPYTQIANRSPSELIRTMNEAVIQVFGTTVYALMSLAASVISIVSIVAALLLSAPLPTMVLVVYFGLASVGYLKLVKPKARGAGAVAAEAAREAWRTALAALGGLKETHLRGSAHHFVRNYRVASMHGAYASRTAGFIGMLPRYLLEVLFIVAVGVILTVGILSDPDGGAGSSMGILALFVAAGFRVLPAITGLIGHVNNLRFGTRFLDVVYAEIEDEQRLRHEGAPAVKSKALSFDDQLALRDVSFRYPQAREDALKGVSLIIPKGNVVAFVGGSGAGKTTLVDLVLGLHEPTRGRIEVDGEDIRGNMKSWQALIGYVPQDVYLFEATLAENIAFDQDLDGIDHKRLDSAVEAAQLGGLVASLPKGVMTPVGERGAMLSGGQRQRVGVARALYRSPRLLVLDEATSALDNETEHALSEAVYGLRGTITVLIVAHRLSTVQNADKIVYLDSGEVRGTGTFDELRRTDETFARLAALGSLRGAGAGRQKG